MPNYKRFYNNDYQYVFFTIVTYNRQEILIDNINLLKDAFRYVLSKFNFEIFACSILKNHLHLILKLENSRDYSEIIRLFKYYFSNKLPKSKELSKSKLDKREKGIWQRRFWEHTIKNENDLYKHLDYIHYNSYKHYQITPQNWQYSSFNKFVKLGYYDKNWCNINDENEINDLDYE